MGERRRGRGKEIVTEREEGRGKEREREGKRGDERERLREGEMDNERRIDSEREGGIVAKGISWVSKSKEQCPRSRTRPQVPRLRRRLLRCQCKFPEWGIKE